MSVFEENILRRKNGKDWLNQLSVLLSTLSEQFHLRDLKPYPNLTFNYVVAGYQDMRPITLKVGMNLSNMEREYYSLKQYKGLGVVELLDADLSKGALLLAQALPGTALQTMPKIALETCCLLTHKMHQAKLGDEYKFPELSDWLSIIDQDWDFDGEVLSKARGIKRRVLNASQERVLLHGDLNGRNVVSHGDEWIVLDPKGMIGDPIYDFAGILVLEYDKPVSEEINIKDFLQRRMKYVADQTKVDFTTIWEWTFIRTVAHICRALRSQKSIEKKINYFNLLMTLKN